MNYSIEYNGKGRWVVMKGDRYQEDFKTQALAEKYVADQKVFEIFRANCMDFAGNYEVSPGQALKIAAILSAHTSRATVSPSVPYSDCDCPICRGLGYTPTSQP